MHGVMVRAKIVCGLVTENTNGVTSCMMDRAELAIEGKNAV